MKVIIDKDIPYIRGLFEPYSEVVYLSGSHISREDVIDADALIIRTRTICNKTLLEGTSVQHIASATIGTDHIDTAWCNNNGVAWSNAPGCNSAAVMQYTVCALLHLSQKYKINLQGKTIGIVGVGNIGKKMEKAAAALGMNVLLNDPPRQNSEQLNKFVSLSKIAECADFITFHVPLIDTGEYPTNMLVNDMFFNQLKKKPFIINTSRGEIIDETSLLNAIKTQKIRGMVLDVWNNEPNINKELLNYTDISTFHIAGYSISGKQNASKMVVESVSLHFNLPIKFSDCLLGTELDYSPEFIKNLNSTYDISYDSKLLKTNPDSFEQLRLKYILRNY